MYLYILFSGCHQTLELMYSTYACENDKQPKYWNWRLETVHMNVEGESDVTSPFLLRIIDQNFGLCCPVVNFH